jgi:hypothetical protein
MGIVRDDLGKPLPGIKLTISAQGAAEITESNDRGEFTFAGLALGRHILGAPDSGYLYAQRSVWITRENMARIDATLADVQRISCFEDSGHEE